MSESVAEQQAPEPPAGDGSPQNEPSDHPGAPERSGAPTPKGQQPPGQAQQSEQAQQPETAPPVEPNGRRRPQIGDTRPAPSPLPQRPIRDALSASQAAGSQSTAGGGGQAGGAQGGGAQAASGAGRSRRRRGGRGRSRGSGIAAGASGTAEVRQSEQGPEPRPADGRSEPRPAEDGREPTREQGREPAREQGRRRSRERGRKAVGRYLMCVHVEPEATQIAVLEGRALVEHYVARPQDDAHQIIGNIYRGRVKNVLPGMEAAFVDIGTPKNAVLYWGDVSYDRDDIDRQPGADRIEHLLRPGQTIVCQVTKNPIGLKGARLTQEVSLPGRFVVLVPDSSTYGISRRLDDNERKRLRRILDEVKPENHGLIVRTAAQGASKEDLRRDVLQLVAKWEEIDERARRKPAPSLLYSEPHLAVRIIREELTDEHRAVLIDDRELYEVVQSYVAEFDPTLAERVEFYDRSTEPLPLFERHHVHEQLHKALDRKVWLPSGGSIIIERTEALTVIDVNTGKNVGSSSLEETVFENNLEAAEEVARQLRLRDIGGIIVIDFIDMEIKANRQAVLAAFKTALARDKTPTQVFDISELGLVEMTRKRVGEGLVETLSQICPMCKGRGIVFEEGSVA